MAAAAMALPALVFSSESSSSTSSDEMYLGTFSLATAEPSAPDHRPHKLRKSLRPPPTSFRSTSSFAPNAYLSPLASSSEIARATAIATEMDAGPFKHPAYLRLSPQSTSSTGGSTASCSSPSDSLSRSTSLTTPPASTRKLTKRRNPDSPPLKSKSLKRNFKVKSPFSSKNPTRMSLYSDSLPPMLSTSPFPWHEGGASTPPAIDPIQTLSPMDMPDFTVDHSDESGMLDPGSGRPGRKRGTGSGANLMRRWSLLEVPDEVLAVELEEMRRVTKIKERKRTYRAKSENHHHGSFQAQQVPRLYSSGAFVYGGPVSGQKFWLGDDDDDDDDESGDDVGSEGSDVEEGWNGEELDTMEQEEEDWKRTRRALFCCRELIRTEKSYSARLVQLRDGQTLTPPPTLLMKYLPALIMASNTLLDNFAQDPTAYGVSKAFIDAESTLENAFVSYCGVVGEVFMNRGSDRRKLVRSTRRTSFIDPLLTGGRGESMRGSKYAIAEELMKSLPPPMPEARRQTAPPDFGTVDIGRDSESRSQLSIQPEKPKRRPGALKRTMSLFKKDQKKRKSLPPLPIYVESDPIDSPKTPNTRSSFYHNTFARTSSLLSLAFGLGMTPTTPAKEPPPPVPPKDHRFYTESSPPPVPSKSPTSYDFPTHVGQFASSSNGHEVLSNTGHEESTHQREKVPTVRDLAILPTQRIMRFVLLYRDLLNHTPMNSPTRPLVESALEGAVRIAGKCDRAQGNAAFLRRGHA